MDKVCDHLCHTIRLTIVPGAAINIALLFEFKVEADVDVESPPDTDPVDLEGYKVLAFVAGDANCAPTARAAALKAAKGPSLPLGPGHHTLAAVARRRM